MFVCLHIGRLPSVIMTYEFRIQDKIEAISRRAVEHGFIECFKKRTNRIFGIKKMKKFQVEFTFETISFNDLQFFFVLYLLAMSISTIVLVAEVLFIRLWKIEFRRTLTI